MVALHPCHARLEALGSCTNVVFHRGTGATHCSPRLQEDPWDMERAWEHPGGLALPSIHVLVALNHL